MTKAKTFMEAYDEIERLHITAARYHLVPEIGTIETALNITSGSVQLAFMDMLKALDEGRATELQIESLEVSMAEFLRDMADMLENKKFREYGNDIKTDPETP